MRLLLASLSAALLVTAAPDGPGHHHHHGAHHGDHHAPHHAEHGAAHHAAHTVHGSVHHAEHGAHHGDHHAPHHAEHGVVSLGQQQAGGVVQVASVPVHHNVHVVQPVHSVSGHFSVQSDPHHHQPAPHHAEHHGPHHAQPHHAPANSIVAAPATKTAATPTTLADLVATNPKFSTLYTAVQAAGLTDVLAGAGPLTVFAPTNTAFDKVPVDTLNGLLADKAALTAVLTRHVVPGAAVRGKNIPPGTTQLATAGGEEVGVTRDKFIQVTSSAGQAYIVLFDQIASNGVLHAVDTVF
jgi:uncharacterized surface protein with fasciclin (FAS1) repeats